MVVGARIARPLSDKGNVDEGYVCPTEGAQCAPLQPIFTKYLEERRRLLMPP